MKLLTGLVKGDYAVNVNYIILEGDSTALYQISRGNSGMSVSIIVLSEQIVLYILTCHSSYFYPYFDTRSTIESAGREYLHGIGSLGSNINALLS